MERRHIRELRVKEQIKQVLKDEICKVVYDRGELKNNSINFELMDLHQNYNNEKNVLTTYGGHFQQLYYVVCSVMEMYEDDLTAYYKRRQENPNDELNKKAQTPRELMVEQFFLPFLAQYFRDTKMEAFTFMSTQKMQELMTEAKVNMHNNGHFDLAKMNKEQYMKFRNYFIEERMFNPILLQNTNDKAMDLLL